jgi:hypothetical protein
MVQARRNENVLVNIERRRDALDEDVIQVIIGVGPIIKVCAKRGLPFLRLTDAMRIRRIKEEGFKLQLANSGDPWPRC